MNVFYIRNLAQSVAQNLTSLTYGATLGELTSLEELVSLCILLCFVTGLKLVIFLWPYVVKYEFC